MLSRILRIPNLSRSPNKNNNSNVRVQSSFRRYSQAAASSDPGSDPGHPAHLLREEGFSVLSRIWIHSYRTFIHTSNNPILNLNLNLSANLRRFELWVIAYQKARADQTGSYLPKAKIPREDLDSLLALRKSVLDGRFRWGSRIHAHIRSPRDHTNYAALSKNKTRDILTTTQPTPFQDRIVQEILLMILEPIYEPRFSARSFAFRPGRTAHTALRLVRRSFPGYLWYIKADLTTILDGINPALVLGSLMRYVRDKVVVDLVRSALVTPVVVTDPALEKPIKKKMWKYQKKRKLAPDEPKPDPYWLETFFGFAPTEAQNQPVWGHCGVLSTLLANICLDELDKWLDKKAEEFYKPSKTEVTWSGKEGEASNRGNTSWPEFVPSSGPDETRKMDYIRFGGHVLIGIRGPRSDAAVLRQGIVEFCDQKYGIRLDGDTLPIEHITKGIMFLDHILCRQVVYPTQRYTASGGKIISKKGVGTLLSVTASLKMCIRRFQKLKLLEDEGEPNPQPCLKMFWANQAVTNSQINKLLSTICEWYKYADNRKKITHFCSFILRGSLAKLYAAKYKLPTRAKVYKIASRNLSQPLNLKERVGVSPEQQTSSLRKGLAEPIEGVLFMKAALIPGTDRTPFPGDWRPDHENTMLEYLKLEDPTMLETHRSETKEQGLVLPQDLISVLVWYYKKNVIPSVKLHAELARANVTRNREQKLLVGSEQDRPPGEQKDDEVAVISS